MANCRTIHFGRYGTLTLPYGPKRNSSLSTYCACNISPGGAVGGRGVWVATAGGVLRSTLSINVELTIAIAFPRLDEKGLIGFKRTVFDMRLCGMEMNGSANPSCLNIDMPSSSQADAMRSYLVTVDALAQAAVQPCFAILRSAQTRKHPHRASRRDSSPADLSSYWMGNRHRWRGCL